jgi:hypothetical protein
VDILDGLNNMSYNEELFKKVYRKYYEFCENSPDKNLRRKLTKLKTSYLEVKKNCEWITNSFWSVIHEIKTYIFISGFGNVKIQNDDYPGPDFHQFENKFECVIASFGKTQVENFQRNGINSNVSVTTLPRTKLHLRITNAVKEKKKQYYRNIKNGVINTNDPFILAIDISMLSAEYRILDENRFGELLLVTIGAGEMQIVIDKNTMQKSRIDYKRYDVIKKTNNSEVEVAIFLKDDYKFISAILFTSAELKTSYNRDNCIFMINPNANNKFDIKNYPNMKYWELDKDTMDYKFYN